MSNSPFYICLLVTVPKSSYSEDKVNTMLHLSPQTCSYGYPILSQVIYLNEESALVPEQTPAAQHR